MGATGNFLVTSKFPWPPSNPGRNRTGRRGTGPSFAFPAELSRAVAEHSLVLESYLLGKIIRWYIDPYRHACGCARRTEAGRTSADARTKSATCCVKTWMRATE